MEKKKLQSISIAALIVSILPLAALIPSFLHLSLSDGIRTFGSLCAEQGKPQCYQYRINSNQCFLVVADGGNCCTRFVPYFRSVRKWLCTKLEKSLDVV